MQCNYAAKPKKEWVKHVINEENPGLALAQNFLLHHNLDDKIISKKGEQYIYVSDALAAFERFNKADL